MLKSLRGASNSLFIKVLFGAIIFSFCLWGVGDIIKNYSASQPVIKVDGFSIHMEKFAREYNQARQKVRNAGNRVLTDAEMKALDIKGSVLERMTNELVMERTIVRNGIVVSKKTVLGILESMPEFQRDGAFDLNVYSEILRRSGISEASFSDNIKSNIAHTQLLHPMMVGYKIPNFIKEAMISEFCSKKKILIGTIKVEEMKLDDAVTNSDIEEYYHSNPDKYKQPELRDISILVIDSSKLVGDTEIASEEVEEYYQANKDAFAGKEFRSFERFIFDNPKDADTAWAMMKKGSQSKDVVRKLTPRYEEINDMEKSDFPKELGDELFYLKETGDVSSIVNAGGGRFIVYRLTDVDVQNQKPRSEVDGEIKAILRSEKMNNPEFYQKVKTIKNKIDDSFGAGKTVEQIADEAGMKVIAVKQISKGKVNEEVLRLTEDEATRNEINDTIFTIEEKQASAIIDSHDSDTMSFVVYADKVVPAKIPELNDIKEAVKKDCIRDRKNEIARSKTIEILEERKDTIAKLSKVKGVKTYWISKKEILLHNQSKSKNVTEITEKVHNINVVMDVMSALEKGGAKHWIDHNGDYLIIGIEDVKQSTESDAQFGIIIDKHVDGMSQTDFPILAISAFKKQCKIKIDDELVEKSTAAAEEEDGGHSL